VSKTQHVAMGKAALAKLDKVLRAICKERKCAVEAPLDCRLSYRERDPNKPKQASWLSYARFLLSDGHTVYIPLRNVEDASVSSKPDKFAQSKIEKRLARQKKKRLAKARRKEIAHFEQVHEETVKQLTSKKAARKVKVVAFDEKLSTLEGGSMRKEGK
jgi:outer membrane lipoprotein-sorting protein